MASRLPLDSLDARRIAIIKPSALGDIMHALPVLGALRARFPAAHIAWIVNRLYQPLLADHPHLDATIPFDRQRRNFFAGAWSFAAFLGYLRRQAFDLVIDLQGLLRSGIMARATGAARRIGLSSAREGGRWFYTDAIEDGGMMHAHAVDRYWKVVEALGAGQRGKQFLLPVAPAALLWAEEKLRLLPRPVLAVGVGARWLTKRWPPEHFAALLRLAQEHYGGSALFIGAPDEADLARQAATRTMGPKLDLTGQTTLPQLAALIAHSDVLLANDTGPLHLAVALGRPVVAPYTCTQVRLTGPYGQSSRAVETGVWCRGSRQRTCDRLECMNELTPQRLWPALEEVLRPWNNSGVPLGPQAERQSA